MRERAGRRVRPRLEQPVIDGIVLAGITAAAAGAGAVSWLVSVELRRRAAIREVLGRVARELGGRVDARRRRAEATVDGVRVEVAACRMVVQHAARPPDFGYPFLVPREATADGLRVTVLDGGRWLPGLALAWKGSSPPWTPWDSRATVVETGDAAFDARFVVRGDAPLVMAGLDAAARAALRAHPFAESPPHDDEPGVTARIVDGRFEISRIRRFDPRTSHDVAERAVREARDMVAVAKVLDRGNKPPIEWLLEGVGNDPPARRAHLATLLLASRDSDRVREACRGVLHDADPMVRLLAARALGAEGDPVLLDLAGAKQVSPGMRLQAILEAREHGAVETRSFLGALDAIARDARGDPAVRAAARDAAARVEAVERELGAGRVSLAATPDTSGRLSPADDPAGRLSRDS